MPPRNSLPGNRRSAGPKAFPRLLGIGLLITAGMLFMEMRRARKTGIPGNERMPSGERRHLAVIAAVAVWTGLYFAVFERWVCDRDGHLPACADGVLQTAANGWPTC